MLIQYSPILWMHGFCDDDPDSRYICTKVEIQVYMLSFIWTKSSVLHINRLEKIGFWSNRGGVSNHQGLDCFLKRLFRRRSKKISKLLVTGVCEAINRWPVDSRHRGPVTGKIFTFDDVITCVMRQNTTQHHDVPLTVYHITTVKMPLSLHPLISVFTYKEGFDCWYEAYVFKHCAWQSNEVSTYSICLKLFKLVSSPGFILRAHWMLSDILKFKGPQ